MVVVFRDTRKTTRHTFHALRCPSHKEKLDSGDIIKELGIHFNIGGLCGSPTMIRLNFRCQNRSDWAETSVLYPEGACQKS